MTFPDLRNQVILTELAKTGRVFVKGLAERLDVSRETIRRDLKQLELGGHLRCTYGGGVRPVPEGDQPIAERLRVNAREKARIAAKAAGMVEDDTTIFIDTGTTTLALARHLIDRSRVRVFTNSLDVAQLLSAGASCEVTVVGGVLRPRYRALMGHRTVEAIAEHLFDAAFVGIGTVDYVHGFMDFGQEEVSIRRALVKHAKRVIVLADGSKFGRQAAIRAIEFRQVSALVTDAAPRPDFIAQLQEAGVEIVYA